MSGPSSRFHARLQRAAWLWAWRPGWHGDTWRRCGRRGMPARLALEAGRAEDADRGRGWKLPPRGLRPLARFRPSTRREDRGAAPGRRRALGEVAGGAVRGGEAGAMLSGQRRGALRRPQSCSRRRERMEMGNTGTDAAVAGAVWRRRGRRWQPIWATRLTMS